MGGGGEVGVSIAGGVSFVPLPQTPKNVPNPHPRHSPTPSPTPPHPPKKTSTGEYIDDTEDLINIELDYSRNRLLRLEIMITVGGWGVWGMA